MQNRHLPRRAALAIAAGLSFTSGAWAQSSVTIGGYLDTGIYRDTSGQWNVGTIQRSNLEIRGIEDLGGGLSATFKLSTRFELDTGALEGAGSKPLWHGESTVGLKGGLGSIRLGRALDAMYNNDWQFDPWYYFDRIASPAWDLWHYNFPSDPRANNGSPDYGRLNNGIFYDSPTVAGFSVHLSGSPEKDPADPNHAMGGSLTYVQGPFAAMLAHEKNSAGNTDTFVGLKGGWGGVSLMGAYDVSKADSSRAKALTLGAQYTVGAMTFNAGWGKVDVNGVRAQSTVGVGAIYALSKRTSVYVDAGKKRYPSESKNTYGVGMAHSF